MPPVPNGEPPALDPPTPGSAIPPVGSALPDDVRRILGRFTYGYCPALHAQVHAAGDVTTWFEQQLDPAAIPDDAADEISTWWNSIGMSHTDLWQANVDGSLSGWVAIQNYARWVLHRRIYSQRQVHEVMTEFWEDHFHIALADDFVFPYRADYGVAVRRFALGKVAELLKAVTTHPAMSLSLDNAFSTKWAPNENLGRELLELHTVGVGNFSEDDVKNSARILTGYAVDLWKTWDASYQPDLHWTGPVQVMEFSHSNGDADGRPVVDAYLDYLARHPMTARHLATKLAKRFVADDPPDALVERLATAYLAHDTDIRPVLRLLVGSPEFRDAAGKVRTPLQDIAATYRSLGIVMQRPIAEHSGANDLLWCAWSVGQTPFTWPRPDGTPVDGAAWSGTSRVLSSMNFHLASAAGWWPLGQVVYRSFSSWWGGTPLTFAELVERLSLELFARSAPDRVRQACAQGLNSALSDIVGPDHPVASWRMPELLAVLLDSPEHLVS